MSIISSIGNIISKTDIIIQLIVLSLAGMSIFIWSIFFAKIRQFKKAANKMKAFEKKFWSGIMLEEFYTKNHNRLAHYMGKIFTSAMEEWITSQQNKVLSDHSAKDALRNRIAAVTSQAIDKIEADLIDEIESVSTITSLAPFFGLFGTVWGIMNTFKAIAGSLTVTLNTIAPGIAEALITTAIGIFVAICGVFIYSILSSKVAKCIQKINAFRTDLFVVLSRELDYYPIEQKNPEEGDF
ncbi:MAG: MotA/TolQ/ExbB proton channel family protein [Alphaproteobacteria bacterium]|nr:MotA/TolQ/ExbB proton channel family protein [Rickettsiales bacterium]